MRYMIGKMIDFAIIYFWDVQDVCGVFRKFKDRNDYQQSALNMPNKKFLGFRSNFDCRHNQITQSLGRWAVKSLRYRNLSKICENLKVRSVFRIRMKSSKCLGLLPIIWMYVLPNKKLLTRESVQKMSSCQRLELQQCKMGKRSPNSLIFLGVSQQLRRQNFAPFFDPSPPCVDSYYTLSVDKNRHFLTPFPSSCPSSY